MIDVERLRAEHTEELRGAEKYRQMAEEYPEWRGVLHDIAHDEQHHADMLKHIIEHTTK